MTTTMPDWPSLWPLAPGLKPDEVEYNEKLCAHGMGWILSVRPDVKHPPAMLCGDATMCAPYCRDAAVRFLMRVGKLEALGAPPDGVAVVNGFDGDTLDAALFAACKAVIDARGKLPGVPAVNSRPSAGPSVRTGPDGEPIDVLDPAAMDRICRGNTPLKAMQSVESFRFEP